MLETSYSNRFYWFAVGWLLLLFAGSLYSPPTLISDPGIGFLDMINFAEGGRFQYHRTPSIEDLNTCVEMRTTWWSPGQWFFVYVFTLTGLSLSTAISITVLVASWIGLIGWMKLYRYFQFNKRVVFYAGLLILFSRYLFSAFQLYPGGSILEFAAAPWLLLLWLKLERESIWLQAICLLPLLIISYFIKSSMLIFWLGVIGSNLSLFSLRKIPWLRLMALGLVFVAGKYFCDLLFTGGGATPFSYAGNWINWREGDLLLLLQRLLFLLAAPLTAVIGVDDYINYFLQKPGHVLFKDGHPVMVGIYVVLIAFFGLLIRRFVKKAQLLPDRYRDLLVAVTGVFLAFFLYSFLSGKQINGYEESRHFRLAGLLLLPFVIHYAEQKAGRYFLMIPALMFVYAGVSYFQKVKSPKVVSEKYGVALSSPKSQADYAVFQTEAKKSDLVYVIHSSLIYDLDQCKAIYYQDDFASLDMIRSRNKTYVTDKTILFLFPERFAVNGKRDAVLANFIASNSLRKPDTEVKQLNGWELVRVVYY
ncbi:hypothetical protein [Lacibacter sp.]|uniref:hypothetical protein n=1 Tax=Lacibacter sp. TaxID=1915409 RepID=UPI002B4AEA2E|nr:hypothetical protein [Lacibacter sp.]HLP36093.1 hypothetical protein [Lacibacter sp.]